jgi:PhnB protein
MGSDVPEAMGSVRFGNYSYVSIGPDSAEDARRIFDALAEGGTVEMPLQSTFWDADFGMLTDKYGVGWMVNYSKPHAG